MTYRGTPSKKPTHLERLARARKNGMLADGVWITTVEHKPACRHVHRPLKCRCLPRIHARNVDTGRVIEIGRNGELLGRGRAH